MVPTMLNLNDLRPEQENAIDFLYEHDASLLLADVGTGKTVIVLTALAELMKDDHIGRVLVVAPKRVCNDVWETEEYEWSHFNRHTSVVSIAGSPPIVRATLLADRIWKIVTVNYESLAWLMHEYPKGLQHLGFNVLVLDEIDKLKDPKSKRFKGTGAQHKKPHKGIKKWRQNFEFHIGMTGTPQPNNLLDIWSQVYMIDGGERLGDNYYAFRKTHFYQTDYLGYSFDILPGHEEIIHDAIKDITFRIAIKPSDGLPVLREMQPRWIDLPGPVAKQYRQLEKDYLLEVKRPPTPGGAQVYTVEAESAGVLYGKLRQLAQGFLYCHDEQGKEFPEGLHSGKYTELDSLISELQGEQLIIVYHFAAQLKELIDRYGDKLGYLAGGVSDADASRYIEDWNAGELPLLAIQPQSAGHGLNLQKSGAHHIVMLTIPESAGMYQQVIGRLLRTGNTAPEIIVHSILTRSTIEVERLDVVHGKITNQQQLLDAMEARQ